jgi:hypothetical protein
MDLQWKIAANYNVRPCKGKRNAARARTMGNNGKNNAKNNGNNRKFGRLSMSGCSTGRQTAALRARRCQAERAGWQSLRIRLGGIPTLSFMPLAQTMNTRNKEITTKITTQQIREG